MSLSTWIHEVLYPEYRQSFLIKKMLVDKQSEFQHIQLFETKSHGRVLMLDDVVQLTERDEFIYHEMLVHVPLLAHPKPKQVLIIGGGDGGAAKRVLKHPNVRVVLVDIDPEVTNVSKRYLKSISEGVFDDERLTVLHEDGAHYLGYTEDRFDVILVDRGDPIGPTQALFEEVFYQNCKRTLAPGGILVSLAGVPFMQNEEFSECIKSLKLLFKFNTCYTVSVPTYIGGQLALTWSSNSLKPNTDIKQLRRKAKNLNAQFYTPELHLSSFVLPKFISDVFK